MILVKSMPTSDALGLYRFRLHELCRPNRFDRGIMVTTSAMRVWMLRVEQNRPAENRSFVALVDDHPVAHAMTHRNGPEFMFGVFVDPSARRQGIGKALYNAAHKYHGGAIYVSPPDDEARAFYRSIGVRW